MFFEALTAHRFRVLLQQDPESGTVSSNTKWSEISNSVPGRTSEMCESLFNLNKTFLSLPIGAVTAVAFSASMNDQYGKDLGSAGYDNGRDDSEEYGDTRNGDTREDTPPFGPGDTTRDSPGRAHLKQAHHVATNGGAPRVVGRRTPRSHPSHVKKKDVHSPEYDALEMAGQALVSMSPAPVPNRGNKQRKEDGKHGGDDPARGVVSETAFGSPAPSPKRVEPRVSGDDISNRASSRALFPAGGSDDDTAKGTTETGVLGTDADADDLARGRVSGLDDEAFGALDGLFMLADASTKAFAGSRKKGGKFAGKPPRAPTPRASPARVRKGDANAVATPAHARFGALGVKDALEVGLGVPPPDGRLGLRLSGQSRKSALKATQPVRLRDGVAGGGFYKSPGVDMYLHPKQSDTTAPRPNATNKAWRHGTWRYADPDTPGTAQLTKGLGLMGPRHVEEDTLETRLGSGASCFAQGIPGTPRGTNGVAGTPAGTPVNRRIPTQNSSLFASTPGVLRGAPSAARRRWFLAEHFYGTIDKPWFVADGYGPFLTHLGLDKPEQKFSKKEWLEVRTAMGAPRRLSLPFLRHERISLERWRVETRNAWARSAGAVSKASVPVATAMVTDDAEGAQTTASQAALEDTEQEEDLSEDLSRAFEVGDRVAARHPRVLNVNTGSILVLRGARCLVQFDRVELGVELVKDINIAHLPHHLDALLLEEEEKEREEAAVAAAKEAALLAGDGAAAAIAANIAASEAAIDDEAAKAATASAIAAATKAAAAAAARGDAAAGVLLDAVVGRAPETADAVAAAARTTATRLAPAQPISGNGRADRISIDESSASAREDDTCALAEVTNALDLKELCVTELRAMNDAFESKSGDAKEPPQSSPGGTVLEPFQRQYANTVLKLRECNTHLQSAISRLRQRHRSRENGGGNAGAWRRFAPGGGTGADGNGGSIFSVGDDAAIAKDAKDGSGSLPSAVANAVNGTTPSVGVTAYAHEIVAASTYVAWCRLCDSKKLKGGSTNKSRGTHHPSLFAAKALGALLAVQQCTDHGVAQPLFRAVCDLCLSTMSPTSSKNAPALGELKASFEKLRVTLFEFKTFKT